jgi:branched-subunit amino acid aminotransferase/4-amino-4-deoxychorismate lyase
MSAIEIVSPGEKLTLDPSSSGFAHGYGLFETMRLRNGALELWEAHWQRLTRSARHLGIACSFDSAEALEVIKILAKKLPPDAVIKLSLLKEGESSKLFVYSRPPLEPPEELGLLMETPCRIHENSPLSGHKTHNYLESLLVLEAARERGCFDGLRLDSKGRLAEGAISNIFFLRRDRLHTPGLQSGPLPGVVRQALFEIVQVEEGNYGPGDLVSADAVYLTNASIGLQPVDWLLSEGKKIQLQSRKKGGYARMRGLLEEHIRKAAVQVR